MNMESKNEYRQPLGLRGDMLSEPKVDEEYLKLQRAFCEDTEEHPSVEVDIKSSEHDSSDTE